MKVPANRWRTVLPALGVLMLAGWASARPAAHAASDEATEVAFLIQEGTADSLATASLLAHLTRPTEESEAADAASTSSDPAALIQKAVALAPERPELTWLQYRDCQQRRCPDEMQIAARLKTLDPDNGFVWLTDLRAAQSQSTPEITQIIVQMAATRKPQVYWNKLTVMMFDALTHRGRSQPPTAITRHADDRLSHVTGILAAVDIPIFQTIAHACRLDQFELPGRRAACASLMARLETSDAVITQNLSVSLQESWWPVNGLEHEALRRKYLQLRYLSVASNRMRELHADRDAQMRIDAMRHLQREEDVERAMLTVFHEPLERPADWHSPGAE